jgi:2-polyprenyl-3-methyl-5-hydroxy-6-metoxy-1,4-benzoquinol methylase
MEEPVTEAGMAPPEGEALAREVREAWEHNALWWDEYMGEGRDFQNLLIGPATERLLEIKPGEVILDVACGNGAFSRRMAELGARVVAFDLSESFIKRARERTSAYADRIDYLVLDASDEGQLLELGRQRFDSAVCTMALMDMITIQPLISALRELLQEGGRFVFSVLHPCFNSSSGCSQVAEEEDREGEIHTRYSVKVWKYIQPTVAQGLGVVGQPVAQYYFHRPLSVLFGSCFGAGFVLDGLEEPVFPPSSDRQRAFSWANFGAIPPVMVARMRPRTDP